MIEAVAAWARDLCAKRPDISRLGLFGSYGKGEWGPGSDADIIVIVRDSRTPFVQRSLGYDTTPLPVPVDLIVYTEQEWERLAGSKFHSVVMQQAVWLHPASAGANTARPAKGSSSGEE